MMQPVKVSQIGCDYRVNKESGRYQLNAEDILKYLAMVKG